MDLEAAKAELAADVVEALAIAFGKFPLRALLQPADRNDDKSHEHFPAVASVCQECVNRNMRAHAR